MGGDELSLSLFGQSRKPLVRHRESKAGEYKKGIFIPTHFSHLYSNFRKISRSVVAVAMSRQSARNLIPVDVDTEGLTIKTYENEE